MRISQLGARWETTVSSRGLVGQAAHRLHPVDNQVHQHLLELDPVAHHGRQAIRKP
jgi:hypothetical protein